MSSESSQISQQNKQPNTEALQNLLLLHPLYKQTLEQFLNCLQSSTPALLIGSSGCGLSTLVKQSGCIHSESLAVEAPFLFSKEETWRELHLRSLNTLEKGTEGYSGSNHRKLSDLGRELIQRLVEKTKKCVIVDNAQHLFSNSYGSCKWHDNFSYFSSLLNSGITYHLVGNYPLFKQVLYSDYLHRVLIIHFPTYSGDQGLHLFELVLESFRACLVIEEDPEMQDVQFFFEHCIGRIGLLKSWLLRAFILASNSNDKYVRKMHFVRTALPLPQLKHLLDTDCENEKQLQEFLDVNRSLDLIENKKRNQFLSRNRRIL